MYIPTTIHACIHICIHSFMHEFIHTCIQANMPTFINVYTYIHAFKHAYVHISIGLHGYMHACIHSYIYRHSCLHVHMAHTSAPSQTSYAHSYHIQHNISIQACAFYPGILLVVYPCVSRSNCLVLFRRCYLFLFRLPQSAVSLIKRIAPTEPVCFEVVQQVETAYETIT